LASFAFFARDIPNFGCGVAALGALWLIFFFFGFGFAALGSLRLLLRFRLFSLVAVLPRYVSAINISSALHRRRQF
jgi:hypothetical protein